MKTRIVIGIALSALLGTSGYAAEVVNGTRCVRIGPSAPMMGAMPVCLEWSKVAVYTQGEIDRIANDLRSNSTRIETQLNSFQVESKSRDAQTQKAISDLETAVLKAANTLDQRILNQESLKQIRAEISVLVKQAVAAELETLRMNGVKQ